MRRKVHDNFAQLPAQSYDSLRQSLYNHIKCVHCIKVSLIGSLPGGRSFPDNDECASQIITQLCLALADLYVQVLQWNDFIPQVLQG